jgi:thymidylate synthase (FAD)
MKIQVLDKGYVELLDHMGDDLSPIRSARKSTGTKTEGETDKESKLRHYLWKNEHTSPFESLQLSVEFKLPLFVLNQFLRHRTTDYCGFSVESDEETFRKWFSANEQSARYSVFADEYYEPSYIRGQGGKNKQGSIDNLSATEKVNIKTIISNFAKDGYSIYNLLLGKNMAREQARIVHTQNLYTTRQVIGNFVNWANFLRLRLDEHAQEEAREYARALEKIIKSLWPKTYEVFEEYTLYAKKFSRSELIEMRNLDLPDTTWAQKIRS